MKTFERALRSGLLVCFVSVCFVLFATPRQADGQEEDEEGIFWGEEEQEPEGDEFLEEGEEFGEEEEFFEEGEELLGEEEFGEEEFLGEEGELEFGEEESEEEGESDVEFAEEAVRQGFTIQVTAASPGYVNNTLMTWNSSVDIRASVDLPFLMQIGPIKFRLGAEVATFKFKNYMPIGGEFSGVGVLGTVTFPAGPSSVQLGAGVMGTSPAFVAAQSFGISVANLVDLRIGVRSTTVFSMPDNLKVNAGAKAAWLDGFIAFGYTL